MSTQYVVRLINGDIVARRDTWTLAAIQAQGLAGRRLRWHNTHETPTLWESDCDNPILYIEELDWQDKPSSKEAQP